MGRGTGDSVFTDNEFTTDAGNNANHGKLPAYPMASIVALLNAYPVGAGDTVYVDTGKYTVPQNILLGSTHSGLHIRGPVGNAAILDRDNTTTGRYVFELVNSDDITLSNLSITGGERGISIPHNSDSDDFTLEDSVVFANWRSGVQLFSANDRAVFQGNTFYGIPGGIYQDEQEHGLYITGSSTGSQILNNTFYDNEDYGIRVLNAPNALIQGNELYGDQWKAVAAQGTGTVVRENKVHGNNIGIIGAALIERNTVWNNQAEGIRVSGSGEARHNVVFDNHEGIEASGGSVIANRVYHNTTNGIRALGNSVVSGNATYSNDIGIHASGFSGDVRNNLVFDNLQYGIHINQGTTGADITNNTIFEPIADGLKVSGATKNLELKNNIWWIESGVAVDVDDTAQAGFASDYNLFWTPGNGAVATWQGATYDSLSDWFFALGFDQQSIDVNPNFVSPAGADGYLGWTAAGTQGRTDHSLDNDFHLESSSGTFLGGSLLPTLDQGTMLPVLPGAAIATILQNDSMAIDRGDPTTDATSEQQPNGARVNLGAYGNTSQASQSPAELLQVLSPNGFDRSRVGESVQLQWSSFGPPIDNVDLYLMQQGNSTPVLQIASSIPNTGQFEWTIPSSVVTANDYLIRVVDTGPANAEDVSDSPFTIAAGNEFFVNINDDADLLDNEYTSVPGDNTNTGASSDQPMASLTAVLDSYNLQPGDTIFVDSGSYAIAKNIILSSAQQGIRIQGPTDHVALFDRGNRNTGSYVFELDDADDVEIANLHMTGAEFGVHIRPGSDSDNVTIENNSIFLNHNGGVYVYAGNDDVNILGNTLYGAPGGVANDNQRQSINVTGANATIVGNTIYDSSDDGIWVTASNPLVAENIVSANEIGIDVHGSVSGVVRDNVVFANTFRGIEASGPVAVIGNEVFGHSSNNTTAIYAGGGAEVTKNVVHSNFRGIEVTSTAIGNRVFNNSDVGIHGRGAVVIEANQTYTNSTAIRLTSSTGALVTNNLVYDNTNHGVVLVGAREAILSNNTIYQSVGDAIRLESTSLDSTVANNILWVEAGYGLNVNGSSQATFTSDNNLFYRGALLSGSAGYWNSDQPTLANWQSTSGNDILSVNGDPSFVDVNGADNVFGYDSAGPGIDGGADDNFYLLSGSPAIDAAQGWLSPHSDIEGQPRVDDNGTANAAPNDYRETAHNDSIYSPLVAGTAQNWRHPDGWWLLDFPVGFSFNFYGTNYSSVYVSSNGLLQFGTGSQITDSTNTTKELYSHPRIAALWDNLSTYETDDDIFVDTSQADRIRVRWNATNEADGSDVNFAVTLFDTGEVRFDYGSGNQNLTPTIGIGGGHVLRYQTASLDGQSNVAINSAIGFKLEAGVSDYGAHEFRGSSLDVVAPVVVNTSPQAVEQATAVFGDLDAMAIDFSEPINPIDANALSNYELRSDGGNGVFDDLDDVVYALTPHYQIDATTVSLSIQADTLPVGQYRLTINGDSIHDLAGIMLDGNADSAPGGPYIREFAIAHPVDGDVDGDGTVTATDIDAIYAALNAGSIDPKFDLTLDGALTKDDVDKLVREILGTEYGDANLDHRVNSSDAAILGGNFGNHVDSLWAMGDFNGDGSVNSSDAAILGGTFGFDEALNGPPASSPNTSDPWTKISLVNRRSRRTRSRFL